VRIFVTGPGRCGTVTFAAACKDAHLSCEGRAMTAAHESLMGQEPGWTYPDDHVEAEPRLLWQIHDLLREYPDARWVILHRDHDALVESWAERVPTMAAWSRLALFTGTISPDTIGLFLDFVYDTLEALIPPDRVMHLTTPVSPEAFAEFTAWAGLSIGVPENVPVSLGLRRNASTAIRLDPTM
jgi:hypothetical protein